MARLVNRDDSICDILKPISVSLTSIASKLRVGLFSINSTYSASDKFCRLKRPSLASLLISLVEKFEKPFNEGDNILFVIFAIFLAFFASLFFKFCLKATSGLLTISDICVCT